MKMNREEFIRKLSIATDRAVVDQFHLRVVVIAPQDDLWKIYSIIEPIRPIGMLVEYKPMGFWQKTFTRGIKFREGGF